MFLLTLAVQSPMVKKFLGKNGLRWKVKVTAANSVQLYFSLKQNIALTLIAPLLPHIIGLSYTEVWYVVSFPVICGANYLTFLFLNKEQRMNWW